MANDPQPPAAGVEPAASRAHDAHSGAPHDEAAHAHAHAHAHAAHLAETEQRQSRRLLLVLLLIATFFVFELMGARAAKSDVLEADAFHLLMDVLALGISLAAMRIARARPSPRFTFGLRRAEPLAALLNGALVLGVCIELTRDAAGQFDASVDPAQFGITPALPGGEEFSTIGGLAAQLRERADVVSHCLTDRLFLFTDGRLVQPQDNCSVERAAERFAGEQYRFASILEGLVTSQRFRLRRAPEVSN